MTEGSTSTGVMEITEFAIRQQGVTVKVYRRGKVWEAATTDVAGVSSAAYLVLRAVVGNDGDDLDLLQKQGKRFLDAILAANALWRKYDDERHAILDPFINGTITEAPSV